MVTADMFLGSPPAQLNVPFQVNHTQTVQQSNSSCPGSQASSAPSAVGENRIRRQYLPPADRENIERACDLLILEIIEIIGWDSSADQLAMTGQECLSQACADTGHSLLSFSCCAETYS